MRERILQEMIDEDSLWASEEPKKKKDKKVERSSKWEFYDIEKKKQGEVDDK